MNSTYPLAYNINNIYEIVRNIQIQKANNVDMERTLRIVNDLRERIQALMANSKTFNEDYKKYLVETQTRVIDDFNRGKDAAIRALNDHVDSKLKKLSLSIESKNKTLEENTEELQKNSKMLDALKKELLIKSIHVSEDVDDMNQTLTKFEEFQKIKFKETLDLIMSNREMLAKFFSELPSFIGTTCNNLEAHLLKAMDRESNNIIVTMKAQLLANLKDLKLEITKYKPDIEEILNILKTLPKTSVIEKLFTSNLKGVHDSLNKIQENNVKNVETLKNINDSSDKSNIILNTVQEKITASSEDTKTTLQDVQENIKVSSDESKTALNTIQEKMISIQTTLNTIQDSIKVSFENTTATLNTIQEHVKLSSDESKTALNTIQKQITDSSKDTNATLQDIQKNIKASSEETKTNLDGIQEQFKISLDESKTALNTIQERVSSDESKNALKAIQEKIANLQKKLDTMESLVSNIEHKMPPGKK